MWFAKSKFPLTKGRRGIPTAPQPAISINRVPLGTTSGGQSPAVSRIFPFRKTIPQPLDTEIWSLFGFAIGCLDLPAVLWIWNAVFQFCPRGGQFLTKIAVRPCSYGRFWLLAPRLLNALRMKQCIL